MKKTHNKLETIFFLVSGCAHFLKVRLAFLGADWLTDDT